MAVPVVGFIKQTQPDIVVGCDRGARLYGVAVHSMWSDLESKEERFPTLDRKLHFARLSTSLGLDVTSEAIARIVQASKEEAERQGKQQNGERLRLMFIDDWISSGATRRQILASVEEIGMLPDVDVSFAVMCGSGGDVSGGKAKGSVFWHDNPYIIGVDYTRDGQSYPVRTSEARETRKNIRKATSEAATKLGKKRARK